MNKIHSLKKREKTAAAYSPIPLKKIRPGAVCGIRPDMTHRWGFFTTFLLSTSCLSRSIRFGIGGRTSVHKHPADETLFGQLGSIEVGIGPSLEKMRRFKIHPGEMITIPKNAFHFARCLIPVSEKHPFALALEFMSGNIRNGNSPTERIVPAKKSTVTGLKRGKRRPQKQRRRVAAS